MKSPEIVQSDDKVYVYTTHFDCMLRFIIGLLSLAFILLITYLIADEMIYRSGICKKREDEHEQIDAIVAEARENNPNIDVSNYK